jgi:hypothetical protein
MLFRGLSSGTKWGTRKLLADQDPARPTRGQPELSCAKRERKWTDSRIYHPMKKLP